MLLLISSLQRQACICHRQRLAASPPGCHSLPLARLRLRLAYPLHRGGFHTREFSVHYQLDFESIFNRRRRDLTPRSTENLYPRTLPASARYALKPRSVPKSFFRGLSRKTSPPREVLLYIIIILLYINIAFSLEMSGFVCYNIGCICVYIRNYLKGKAYAVSV